MLKLDYRQTDKKIEIDIYGLVFEIKKEIEEINTDEITEEKNLNRIIDIILGDGSADRINKRRNEDGYADLDTKSALTIITACVNLYVEETTKPIDKTIRHYNNKRMKYNKYRR